MVSEIKKDVDEYAYLNEQLLLTKEKIELLKAKFEKRAETDLQNIKDKTVEYWGTNAKVIVQESATIKPISMTVLKNFFGRTATDFIKTEVKETLNDGCKTFLCAMVKGEYIEDDITSVIQKITTDPKEQGVLNKKLKGKFKSDKKVIGKITGMNEKDAGDYAYLIQEVFAYQTIKQIMKASNFEGTIDDAVTQVKASLIVDETIKIGLESE